MLAVSHCQKVGIGEQDFEPGLSVIQESACCCVKPPSIASKSRACVGLIRTRGGGSPGPAQTATESWSCLPTSLGHHVLDLAFGAPAPSTACVLPLPARDPLASTILASEVGKPLPPCSSPLLLPDETPCDQARGPIAWRGPSLVRSTRQQVGHGSVPSSALPSVGQWQGEGPGGSWHFCSARL